MLLIFKYFRFCCLLKWQLENDSCKLTFILINKVIVFTSLCNIIKLSVTLFFKVWGNTLLSSLFFQISSTTSFMHAANVKFDNNYWKSIYISLFSGLVFINFFEFYNGNTGTIYEICSKLIGKGNWTMSWLLEMLRRKISQPTITCSKLTIETLD